MVDHVRSSQLGPFSPEHLSRQAHAPSVMLQLEEDTRATFPLCLGKYPVLVVSTSTSHRQNSWHRLLPMGQEGHRLRCLTKSGRGTPRAALLPSRVPLLHRQQIGSSNKSLPHHQHQYRHRAEEVAAEAEGGRVDRPA